MQQHSIIVHCITRPGQILCLVARPQENWERMVQLLTSISGGNLAKVVPLDSDGQIPPIYQRMVQKRDIDYILTIGDVPPDLVKNISWEHGVPHGSIGNKDAIMVHLYEIRSFQ
jgi:hypothetical protein